MLTTSGYRDVVMRTVRRLAARLTPPGAVLLAERAGDAGGGLAPDEALRMRRSGVVVGTQRALKGRGLCRRPGTTGDGPAPPRWRCALRATGTPDNRSSGDVPGVPTSDSPLHRPAGTGALYVGPGDL